MFAARKSQPTLSRYLQVLPLLSKRRASLRPQRSSALMIIWPFDCAATASNSMALASKSVFERAVVVQVVLGYGL